MDSCDTKPSNVHNCPQLSRDAAPLDASHCERRADENIPLTAPPGENPPPPAPAPEPAPPEPPPATKIVVSGTKTEREIELETKLAEESDRAKRAEIIAAEHQDENKRLRAAQAAPAKKIQRFGYFKREV